MSMQTARSLLQSILKQLPTTRPLPPDALQAVVSQTLTNSTFKSTMAWETCLKSEVTRIVSRQAQAGTPLDDAYFEALFIRLDITLACADLEAAEATLPLWILSDLFDMHTIEGCVRLFDWLETRSERLTRNMVPSKGKALVLLRQLNNLVRRVSKTGDVVKFNGKILNFLSGAFPLGERSGVNLRGECGPQWEDVPLPPGYIPLETRKAIAQAAASAESSLLGDAAAPMEGVETATGEPTTTPATPAPPTVKLTEEDELIDFYQTFWSVQKPFSNPMSFEDPAVMPMFKSNVTRVLQALGEATKRDRLSSSSKNTTPAATVAGSKRKREDENSLTEAAPTAPKPDVNKDYFFAKFLTNMDLLELEIADLHFRRQIIIQVLILCSYLRTYQASEKEKWAAKPRVNTTRPRRLDLTLSDEDAKWVRETTDKCMEELRAPIGGLGFRTFQDTVADLLDRERAWARWKNDGCVSFEKPPLPRSEFEQAMAKRQRFLEPLPPLEHALGTQDLTDVWEGGYQGREDLEDPPAHTTFERYVRDFKSLKTRIKMKEMQLARAAERAGPPPPRPAPIPAPVAAKPIERTDTPPLPPVLTSPSPHGLPAKPVNPLGIQSRPGTPSNGPGAPAASSSTAGTPTATPARPATPVSETPAEPVPAPAPKKLTDAQLEAFLESRELLLWRGLRAAAQEGILHQFNKHKVNKDPENASTLVDLERLQAKIQTAEADAAAAAKAAAASPAINTSASNASTVVSTSASGEDVKMESGGGAGEGMEVDGAVKVEDAVSPAVLLTSESPVSPSAMTVDPVKKEE
ncbi:hypothetical protein DL93DRAFT_2163154 [Clavulina sp. PMI_390]|nr:hypothetical protein DL93DRAFT_2163154 [Clavulina sp. PMI_390]